MKWLGLLLLLGACVGRDAPRVEAKANPQVTLYGVHIQYFKGGTLYSSGRAAKLTYQRSGGDFTGDEGTLKFPPRSESVSGVEVHAFEFDGNLGEKHAAGKGGVVLHTASGLVGKTATARWDGNASTATGNDPVEVRGPGYALDSKGFAFDLLREDFVFQGPVASSFGGQ